MTRAWVKPSRSSAVLVLALLASACGGGRMATNAASAVGPQLSVERFLQAANARDLETMGRIFGTAGGAALDTGSTFGCFFKKIGSWFGGNACVTREAVEIRMDAIASVLRHRDYRIVGERLVAGRVNPTTRVMVNMTLPNGRSVSDVPFDVVQGSGGRWYLQQVDLQRVMSAGF